jgi:hypothetical protein
MTPLDKKLANAKRQRARDRAQAPDPATIAASIDTATREGHNLRTLLLRLLDESPWIGDVGNQDAACDAWELAERLGLAPRDPPCNLTPLGREVAERLRPEPCRVVNLSGPRMKRRVLAVMRGAVCWARCTQDEHAERIAALLTADDLAQAKAYRSEPE